MLLLSIQSDQGGEEEEEEEEEEVKERRRLLSLSPIFPLELQVNFHFFGAVHVSFFFSIIISWCSIGGSQKKNWSSFGNHSTTTTATTTLMQTAIKSHSLPPPPPFPIAEVDKERYLFIPPHLSPSPFPQGL